MDIFDQQQKGSNSDMFLFSRKANSICVCVCVFLCSAPAVLNSKILTVTVRPEPQPSEPMVVVELSPLINVSESKEKTLNLLFGGRHVWQELKEINVMQGFTFFISCVCIERAVAEEAYLFKALKDFLAPSWPMSPGFKGKRICCML